MYKFPFNLYFSLYVLLIPFKLFEKNNFDWVSLFDDELFCIFVCKQRSRTIRNMSH